MKSMHDINLSQQEFIKLLENRQYQYIFEQIQDYIAQKVDIYLHQFRAYQPYQEDFKQEVFISLLSKALPSKALLKACQEGISYRFYLNKSIRNRLNTLLSDEKKKQNLSIEQKSETMEVDFEKNTWLDDKQSKSYSEQQDLLYYLQNILKNYLVDFNAAFPKISAKLRLLLKIQARFPLEKEEVQACFPKIKIKAVKQFLALLGNKIEFSQKRNKTVYEAICPFFQKYRKEKGDAKSLQRWINHYIGGSMQVQGILDKLYFEEEGKKYKIQTSQQFSDFLYLFFKNEKEKQNEKLKKNVIALPEIVPKVNAFLS